MDVEQSRQDLVQGVVGRPHAAPLLDAVEELLREGGQVPGARPTRGECELHPAQLGGDRERARPEPLVARGLPGEGAGRQVVPEAVAAQLDRGRLPASVGFGGRGKAGVQPEGVQQAVGIECQQVSEPALLHVAEGPVEQPHVAQRKRLERHLCRRSNGRRSQKGGDQREDEAHGAIMGRARAPLDISSPPDAQCRGRSAAPDRSRRARRSRAGSRGGAGARALRGDLRIRRAHPPRQEPFRGLSPGHRPRALWPGRGGGPRSAARAGGGAGRGRSRDRLRRLLPLLGGPAERVPQAPGRGGASRRRVQRVPLRPRRERARRPRRDPRCGRGHPRALRGGGQRHEPDGRASARPGPRLRRRARWASWFSRS